MATHRAWLILVACFAVGCTSIDAALLTGEPQTAIGNKQGIGVIRQRPDGKKAFEYYFQGTAHNDIAEGYREKVRTEMIAGWLGTNRICPSGYVIDKRIEHKQPLHVFHYEGHCK
jgi:hypothetical protein